MHAVVKVIVSAAMVTYIMAQSQIMIGDVIIACGNYVVSCMIVANTSQWNFQD